MPPGSCQPSAWHHAATAFASWFSLLGGRRHASASDKGIGAPRSTAADWPVAHRAFLRLARRPEAMPQGGVWHEGVTGLFDEVGTVRCC